MKRLSRVIALGLLVGWLGLNPALAGTATALLTVSVTVVSSCEASQPSGLRTHSAIALKTAPAVAVNCTLPTPYDVTFQAAESADSASRLHEIRRVDDPAADANPSASRPDTAIVTISY